MKTLGEFYREKILVNKKNIVRDLPAHSRDIRVVKDLFGWKLYSGREAVDCRSEEEARYLKIFLDAGFTEVSVPKNEDYLRNVLPELEGLKKKIDEIINLYLESILSPSLREKLRHEVYMEIAK